MSARGRERDTTDRAGPDEQTLAFGAGTLAATFGSAAFAAFELVLVVIVTRALGPAEAGLFFTVLSLFMLVMGMVMIGPTQGLVRGVAHAVALDRPDDVRHLLILAALPTAALAAVIGAAAAALAPTISTALVGDGAATPYLRAMAPLLPFAVAMHLVLAASRGLGTMKPTVILDRIGVGASRPLLVGLVLLMGGGSAAVGLAWAVPYGIALILSALGVGRLILAISPRHTPSATPLKSLAGSLWAFSSVRGVASGMELTTRWIDIPLVAALASPEAAGIYAAVSRLSAAGAIASRGVMLSFTPRISSLIAKGDLAAAKRSYRLAANWVMAASMPIHLALAAYPAVFLGLFGPAFEGGATALVILSCVKLVALMTGPITIVLLMEGKTWLNAFNATVGTTINVGLNLWLIPILGIEGAAIAWAASIIFLSAAPLVQLYRSHGYHPISPGWRRLLGVLAATIAAVGVGFPALLGMPAAAGLIWMAAVGVPLYLATLYRYRNIIGLDVLLQTVRRRPLALPPPGPDQQATP